MSSDGHASVLEKQRRYAKASIQQMVHALQLSRHDRNVLQSYEGFHAFSAGILKGLRDIVDSVRANLRQDALEAIYALKSDIKSAVKTMSDALIGSPASQTLGEIYADIIRLVSNIKDFLSKRESWLEPA